MTRVQLTFGLQIACRGDKGQVAHSNTNVLGSSSRHRNFYLHGSGTRKGRISRESESVFGFRRIGNLE